MMIRLEKKNRPRDPCKRGGTFAFRSFAQCFRLGSCLRRPPQHRFGGNDDGPRQHQGCRSRSRPADKQIRPTRGVKIQAVRIQPPAPAEIVDRDDQRAARDWPRNTNQKSKNTKADPFQNLVVGRPCAPSARTRLSAGRCTRRSFTPFGRPTSRLSFGPPWGPWWMPRRVSDGF